VARGQPRSLGTARDTRSAPLAAALAALPKLTVRHPDLVETRTVTTPQRYLPDSRGRGQQPGSETGRGCDPATVANCRAAHHRRANLMIKYLRSLSRTQGASVPAPPSGPRRGVSASGRGLAPIPPPNREDETIQDTVDQAYGAVPRTPDVTEDARRAMCGHRAPIWARGIGQLHRRSRQGTVPGPPSSRSGGVAAAVAGQRAGGAGSRSRRSSTPPAPGQPQPRGQSRNQEEHEP
jgi:hypothetical protein